MPIVSQAFQEDFRKMAPGLGDMKPAVCQAKLADHFFLQTVKADVACECLTSVCEAVEGSALDLRLLHKSEVETLCPLDLAQYFGGERRASGSATSPKKRAQAFVEALDELLGHMWRLGGRWYVHMALYHLYNGGAKTVVLAHALQPAEAHRVAREDRREMRYISNQFVNDFWTQQGTKRIVERLKAFAEHQADLASTGGWDKYEESWSGRKNMDAQQLCDDMLKAAAAHGRQLRRALELEPLAELRLAFPEDARERVMEMGRNEVQHWNDKFAVLFEGPAFAEPPEEGPRDQRKVLLNYIKRLRNEPRWPPPFPFHMIFCEPQPRIRITDKNGAHSRTLTLECPSTETKIQITEAGVVQQHYRIELAAASSSECGFEFVKDAAGKPFDNFFRDTKQAFQSELSIEMDEGFVNLRWREEPPRVQQQAIHSVSVGSTEYNNFLPVHATQVVDGDPGGTSRVTFKRFVLQVKGTTKSGQLNHFLAGIFDRNTLRSKYKQGWWETADQLKAVMSYILLPPSPNDGPRLVYNFSPTMLECMQRAGAVNAYKDCKDSVNLTPLALQNDPVKQQLARVLIPDEDGQRIRTLVFEPSSWNQLRLYTREIHNMRMLKEAFSVDFTSLDTFLRWLQSQQSVVVPSFVCVRITGKLSPIDLSRVHKAAKNNESLTLLLQADPYVMAILFQTGILRDPSISIVGSARAHTQEMILLRNFYKVEGESVEHPNQVSRCVWTFEKLAEEDRPELVRLLKDGFREIADRVIEARQLKTMIHGVHGCARGSFLRLVHGDVDVTRDAFSTLHGVDFIDVSADQDVHQRVSAILSSEHCVTVVVLHSHFLPEVQKKSLLQWLSSRERVNSVIFAAPCLHPADFDLLEDLSPGQPRRAPDVLWGLKALPRSMKTSSRVIRALRLSVHSDLMHQIEEVVQKFGDGDGIPAQAAQFLGEKLAASFGCVVPQQLREPAGKVVRRFLEKVFEEAQKEEKDCLPLEGRPPPTDIWESLGLLAEYCVRLQCEEDYSSLCHGEIGWRHPMDPDHKSRYNGTLWFSYHRNDF